MRPPGSRIRAPSDPPKSPGFSLEFEGFPLRAAPDAGPGFANPPLDAEFGAFVARGQGSRTLTATPSRRGRIVVRRRGCVVTASTYRRMATVAGS